MTTVKKVLLQNRGGDTLIPYVNNASTQEAGLVKVDGETITIDNNGVISAIQTLQPITTTTGTLSLLDGTSIYKLTPSGATTLTFSNSTSASANTIYTFELFINMSTVYALTFPSSVTWQDGETPNLDTTGLYFLAFRTVDGGSNWIGNLQGRW